jgi:chromosome segregation ATPase
MKARQQATPAKGKAGTPARTGASAATLQNEPLNELRARLYDTLEELEEARAASAQLQNALTQAEERLAVLHDAEAEQLRDAGGDAARQRYAQELDALRRMRKTLEERTRSDDARRLANAEKRLRSTEATLAQTLQALEEHRVTAVEQRMVADATQHHAVGLEHEMQERTRRAERSAAEAQAALEHARATSEERRIAAAELQTILDATEHRLAQLERTLAAGEQALTGERDTLAQERQAVEAERLARQQEVEMAVAAAEQQRNDLRRELDALRTRADQLKAERASTTTALERTLAELAMQRDVAAGLGIERDAALEEAEKLSRAAAEGARALTALQHHAAQIESALQQATGECAALTARGEALQAQQVAMESTLAAREQELAARHEQREQDAATQRALAHELEGAQARLHEHTRVVRALEAERDTLSGQIAELRTNGARLESELQRATTELDTHARAAAAAGAEHHAVVQHLREVEEALGRRDRDLEDMQATLARERDEWTAARSEFLAALEREGGAQQELVAARQALEEKLHIVETEWHTERDRALRLSEERAQVATALALVRTELKEQIDATAALTSERDLFRERLRAAESLAAETAQRLDAVNATRKHEWVEWETARTERDAELTATHGRVDALSAERDALAAALQKERAAYTQVEAQRQQAEVEKTQLAVRLGEAVTAADGVRRELANAGRQLEHATERATRLDAERQTLQRQVHDAESRAAAAVQRHTQDQHALQSRLADAERARAAAVAAAAQAEEKSGRRLAESQRAAAELKATLERQIAELQTARDAALAEQQRLMQSLRTAGEQQAALERQRQTDAAERTQLHAEIGRLGEARTALQQRLQDTQTQLTAEQSTVRELRDLQAHGSELYQLVEAELQQTRTAKEVAARQVEALTTSLQGREHECGRLQAALAEAERQRREADERHAAASGELDALRRTHAELQARAQALADRDAHAARAAELERTLATVNEEEKALRGRVADIERQLHEATARGTAAAAAAKDAEALRNHLAEGEAERERLQTQVDSLSGQRDALQRERDHLKRRAQQGDDAERMRVEQQRLLEKLDELEQQQGEATQRHSAAVSGYMVELNQRSELLRQRELQIERLTEELRIVQQACEDGTSQLGALRHDRELLELRVRELESVAQAPRSATAKPAGGDALRLAPADAAPAAGTEKAAAAGAKAPAKSPAPPAPGRATAPAVPAKSPQPAPSPPPAPANVSTTPPATSAPKGLHASRSASGVLNVVHLEDLTPLRDAVRGAVGRFGRVKYALAQDAPATVAPPTLLTVNLLVKSIDPLVTLTHADAWGVSPPRAFTYCADASRGTIIGLAEFFPHPFNLEECAARINDRPGGTQRLLVVGESVELLNEIRSTMNRIRCSTSVALDARQAFDLVSMVKPQVVLVDVGLQRAEGLRLIARLRADAAYANVSIGLMWTREIDANEFRVHVARAVRDSPFSTDELARTMGQTVADLGFATEQLRDAG